MAPTRKEKMKTDLDDAVLKFSDKKEELEMLLGDPVGDPPDKQDLPNAGVINTILLELSDK